MPFQNSLSSNHYFCFAVAHKHNPTCRSTRRYTVYNTVKCFTFRLLMIWPRHLTIYLNKNDKLTVLSGFIKGSHLCSSKEGGKKLWWRLFCARMILTPCPQSFRCSSWKLDYKRWYRGALSATVQLLLPYSNHDSYILHYIFLSAALLHW